ncbi:HlyD family type I secretion periplasmic adaptor subunit [Siccirubricoccus sp. KC 17139]|uniref:Membrane fusion protein (MFP) family protein n=1 Tax=Siccirubricoccus soli TaxID=2899147 RepID=A0ABT1DCU3_9PROT|nr:HlyD family type I secretion periplasmic adaptor subunit [Siccirubricoccus soli]MCO6419757.1 HlyD family type I secretion periplasmic adaptor subunit [Siccirubricoccus soli]MCP2685892.1 HlyD family type I secretion periplasmic adaptor subunit [Siccirubricoccus soli]
MSLTTEAPPPPPPAPQGKRALAPLAKPQPGSALPPFPAHPLLDAPAPRTRAPLYFGLAIFLIFVVGFGAWAGLAPLAEASIAPGVVKVEGSRRTIQHLEGGIVREILVRDGDRVRAGQVLVRLDQIQSDSTLETQRSAVWALQAQLARLEAEQRRAREVDFPADLLANTEPRAVGAVISQRALFEARRTSLDSQLAVLETRIRQQQGVISSARGQLEAARRQLVLIQQEEAMRRDLVRQGLARLPDLLAVQRSMAGLEGTLEDLNGQIARASAVIAEAESQQRQVIDQRLQDVGTEMSDARAKLAEAEEKLRAASDVATRRDIVAPDDGTVVNLRVFTLGAVLRPGDPIMDLVPEKDRLVAEVNVQPNDIDVVYPGLQAEIRLPAFKQRLVPYLHGHVSWVAADVTVNEQTRQQYYRAYVLIDRDQIERLPNVFLTPGMPVEAHIRIGERTFFHYLTQPIRDSFNRAFREQ